MSETIDCWHFLEVPAPGKAPRLRYNDRREVKVGETLTVTGEPVLCQHGLHASEKALDALRYAPGALVCRVRLSGQVVRGEDKAVATHRTVLWMADATVTLRRFAIWCAREALLRERAAGSEPDPRSWKALDVTEAWLDGKATDEELKAAAAAAYAAADAAAAAAYAAYYAAYYAAAAARAEVRSAQEARLTEMLRALAPKETP